MKSLTRIVEEHIQCHLDAFDEVEIRRRSRRTPSQGGVFCVKLTMWGVPDVENGPDPKDPTDGAWEESYLVDLDLGKVIE